MDPWDQRLGGFDTCLDGILRHAPDAWRIEFIGLSTDPAARPVGRWLSSEFGGRQLRFYAVMADADPDRVSPIPLSLRFAAAAKLRQVAPSSALVQFHRFEPGLLIRLAPGQKTIHFPHNHPEEVDSIHSDVRWRRWGWLYRTLLKRTLRDATGVVAVDPRTPEWAGRELPGLNGRIGWLAQWADPHEFQPGSTQERAAARAALQQRLDLPAGTRLIGFVGRLERQKDPLLLLRAFCLATAQREDIALVFVGQGRLHGELIREVERLRLRERVRILPPMIRSELAGVYHGVDVVACSSGFEAGPRIVFESLACGTPIVSFDVGQVHLALGGHAQADAGEIVRERTPQALGAALLRVLSVAHSEQRAQLCADAVAAFTPLAALTKLFGLYEDWAREERNSAPRSTA
jgi:glycosyltransferase involved in cell wall biosynthesis